MSEQFDTPEERAFATWLKVIFDVNGISKDARIEVVDRFVAYKRAAASRIRAETIEECARIADWHGRDGVLSNAKHIAADIRALNKGSAAS